MIKKPQPKFLPQCLLSHCVWFLCAFQLIVLTFSYWDEYTWLDNTKIVGSMPIWAIHLGIELMILLGLL